jgi:hypothetical protein
MYIKLPTHKKVIVYHHSMSLELQSHLPIAVRMSQAESLHLLQKAPPRLGKAYAGR